MSIAVAGAGFSTVNLEKWIASLMLRRPSAKNKVTWSTNFYSLQPIVRVAEKIRIAEKLNVYRQVNVRYFNC